MNYLKINKHSRGGYYTTFTIQGKKKFIYGATEDEVDAKYTEMKFKYNQGYNVTDNPTLKEYMIKWYNAFKKGEGALKTQEMYQNIINNHINPVMGKLKVKEVTSTQCQALVKSITSSKSLAHKVRITLNQIFKQAIADKLISFNPVSSTKIIAPDKPVRKCLTPTQRELLLHILKDDKAYPIVHTILYTGMRRGETLALMLNDIDTVEEVIHVTKATEYENSKPKNKKTKTYRGVRDIPIPDAEVLSFFKKREAAKQSLYVFPGHAGGPMGLTEINRIWKKAKKKIKTFFEENKNLQEHSFNLTFRLLRHTYCTGLFDAGIDEMVAAEIMGHDVSIMREVYTHIQESRKKKTIKKLKSLYKEPEEKTEIKESK